MTLKILCTLLVAIIILGCDASIYRPHDRFGLNPEMFGSYDQRGFSSYFDYDRFQPYFYRRNLDDATTTTTDFMGKEYDGESAKKSATRYVISDEELPWPDASRNCKNKGMILASPHTLNEKNCLVEYIRENDLTPKDEFSGYWVGGQRVSDHYEWQSDHQVLDDGWLPGEPNDFDAEDCVELKKALELGWNNNYCELKKRFICERIISNELAKNIDNGIEAKGSDKEYYVQKAQEDVYLPKLEESHETSTTEGETVTPKVFIPLYVQAVQETSTMPSLGETESLLPWFKMKRDRLELADENSAVDQEEVSSSTDNLLEAVNGQSPKGLPSKDTDYLNYYMDDYELGDFVV